MTPAPIHFEVGDLLVATRAAQGLKLNALYLVLEVRERGTGNIVVTENEESDDPFHRLQILGASDLFWVADPADSEPRCQWCGQEAAPGHLLEETVVSPPVSGYPVETVTCHPECAAEWARSMVA